MYGSQEIQTKKQHSLPPTKEGYSMRDKRTHDIHPVRDKSIRHSPNQATSIGVSFRDSNLYPINYLLNNMNKRKYTTALYLGIEQYVAFVRTLRCFPDDEFVSIKMSYDQCKDGIYRHFGLR